MIPRGSGFWLLLLVAIAVLAVSFVKCARAQDEAQVRRDCTADALRYCKAAILKGSRDAILDRMIKNKSRLTPACRQHLW